jgi:colanic acid/amylovoran biosynthesis glycosyltransferase
VSRVAIWRSALLLPSETFIRNQGEALPTWEPTFVGATRVESVLARDSDVVVYPAGGPGRREFLRLKVTGRSPRLQAVLAALRPDVVHAHFAHDGWLVARSAARLGVPLVVTLHGYDVTRQPRMPGPRGRRYRRHLRHVFRRAAALVAVSEHIKGRAVALGADPAKVHVLHTGVPVPARVPDGPKQWDVLFVGRFVEKKGIGDLVEALGTLTDPRPRALFIGSGPLEPAVRARAAALGLDATFLGAKEPAAVAAHMARSRVFVSPSKTAPNGDSEGLPTTIVEAASLGLPVVSTRHSGIPEAVVHGETGLLGAEGDPAAVAANLRRLLGDEALRIRLGEQGRKHVETSFDVVRQARLLEELYASVV